MIVVGLSAALVVACCFLYYFSRRRKACFCFFDDDEIDDARSMASINDSPYSDTASYRSLGRAGSKK